MSNGPWNPLNDSLDSESLDSLLYSQRTIFSDGLDIAMPSSIRRRHAVEAEIESLIERELTRQFHCFEHPAGAYITEEESISGWLNSDGIAHISGEKDDRVVEYFAESLKKEVEQESVEPQSSLHNVPFLQESLQSLETAHLMRPPSKKRRSQIDSPHPTRDSGRRRKQRSSRSRSSSSVLPERSVRRHSTRKITKPTHKKATSCPIAVSDPNQMGITFEQANLTEISDSPGAEPVEEVALKSTMRRFASKLDPPLKWKPPATSAADTLDLGGGLQFVKRIYRKIELSRHDKT